MTQDEAYEQVILDREDEARPIFETDMVDVESPLHSIGDLVYALVNGGRGTMLVRLLSRHDEDSCDVNLYPGSGFKLVVVAEGDLLAYNPYDELYEEVED